MATKKRGGLRTERDTLGDVRVPASALYGAQTQRAVENYPVSGLREHPAVIRAYILMKKAAALANFETGGLDRKLARAISDACDEILGDQSQSFDRIVRRMKRAATKKTRHADLGEADDIRSVPYLVPTPYIAESFRSQFVVDVFQAGAGTSFN